MTRRKPLPLRYALVALAASLSASSFAAPADKPQFADAFAPFDIAAEDVVPTPDVAPGAVDITAIEPASEPAVEQIEGGVASYYGRRFAGRRTANGETFNPRELTAAHRTLPFGSLVRVTYQRTGKSVTVRINDRGPYARGRVIDLSRAAAEEIGLVGAGHGPVTLELVDS